MSSSIVAPIAASDAASAAAVPSSAASSSSSAAASSSSSSTTSHKHPLSTAESEDPDRSAKKQRREERKAQIQQLDEAVTPLYPGYPECRVLIYNVSKKQNVGTIVRTAVAFAATQIIVVGNRKTLNTLGNQNTNRFISWKYFDKWPEARAWMKKEGWKLVGVEIGARAKNISTRPFSEKTVIMLGNEGTGMTQELMDECDEIVYIPQYGRGTASLNVATAASIVLHHFAEYAKYPQHTSIEGAKFEVDETKARQDPGLMFKQQNAAASSSSAAAASSSSSGPSAGVEAMDEGEGEGEDGDAD